MTRLIDADGLKNKFWHGDLVPNKEMYHISEIMYAIADAPTVEQRDNFDLGYIQGLEDGKNERPQGEQKDIDIPKMCEECHSQSYNNGFDAGYELGKEDARKHITELNERIEFLMQQIRLWQSWASTEQQGKDCEENMNEQETFGEWERIDKWAGGIYVGGFVHKDCPMIKVSDHCLYSPWQYRYCPNCGKKMNKEAEND